MSRYFFNLYDGEYIFDDTGTELATKRDVRRHMLITALTHMSDEEKQNEEWQMEALDERGQIVSIMTFGVEEDEPSD